MKMQINKYSLLINISILIITLSESLFFQNRGLGGGLEYVGYALLLSEILISFIKKKKNLDKKKDILLFLVVFLFSGIGLWFQNISVGRFWILQFTVVAIAIISILSTNYMTSPKIIRGAAYAIFEGIFIATVLGMVSGDGIWDQINAGDGIFGIQLGLNCGMVFKNYFSADLTIIYICLSIYKLIDKVVQIFCVLLCVLSNSRGSLLLLVIYWIALNYSIIFKVAKKYRKILISIIIIIGLSLFVRLYNDIVSGFSTYAYRFRGLENSLNYYTKDVFHMFLGNAESFYDKDVSYVMAVRRTTGFDGSLEMAWLNILIKSGLLGIIAYLIIFFRLFIMANKSKNHQLTTCMVALILTYLASSLVEAYIQSIHCIFGVMCYLVINGLYGYSKRQQGGSQ